MIRNQLQLFSTENYPIKLKHKNKKFKEIWLMGSKSDDIDFAKIDLEKSNKFWAYHAGMFDGDGFVDMVSKKNIIAGLDLIDQQPVKELADIYKGIYKYMVYKNENHSPNYLVTFRGNKAIHFLLKICPYLIENKQYVIDILRNYIPNYTPRKISAKDRLEYLPGYFDAEGSFKLRLAESRQKDKIYKNVICVCKFTSTNLDVLNYLKKFISFYFKIPLEDLTIARAKNSNGRYKYDLLINKFDNQHYFGLCLLDELKIKRKKEHIEKLGLYRDVLAFIGKPFGNIDYRNPEERLKYYNA